MTEPKFAVTPLDRPIAELVHKSDHKVLAVWAADCAERTLPYFEEKYPQDSRPRKAVEAARAWAQGKLSMPEARKAAFAAHDAARDAEKDEANCSAAARAAGHAAATAHVPGHAVYAASYAAAAVRDAAGPDSAEALTIKEREWQYQQLQGVK